MFSRCLANQHTSGCRHFYPDASCAAQPSRECLRAQAAETRATVTKYSSASMPLFSTEFNAGISGYHGGGGPGPYQGVDFFDDPYSAAYLLQAILAMEPHFDMFCYWVFSGQKPQALLLPPRSG